MGAIRPFVCTPSSLPCACARPRLPLRSTLGCNKVEDREFRLSGSGHRTLRHLLLPEGSRRRAHGRPARRALGTRGCRRCSITRSIGASRWCSTAARPNLRKPMSWPAWSRIRLAASRKASKRRIVMPFAPTLAETRSGDRTRARARVSIRHRPALRQGYGAAAVVHRGNG